MGRSTFAISGLAEWPSHVPAPTVSPNKDHSAARDSALAGGSKLTPGAISLLSLGEEAVRYRRLSEDQATITAMIITQPLQFRSFVPARGFLVRLGRAWAGLES